MGVPQLGRSAALTFAAMAFGYAPICVAAAFLKQLPLEAALTPPLTHACAAQERAQWDWAAYPGNWAINLKPQQVTFNCVTNNREPVWDSLCLTALARRANSCACRNLRGAELQRRVYAHTLLAPPSQVVRPASLLALRCRRDGAAGVPGHAGHPLPTNRLQPARLCGAARRRRRPGRDRVSAWVAVQGALCCAVCVSCGAAPCAVLWCAVPCMPHAWLL